MAAMVGARRALLTSRYSPRAALDALLSPAHHMDSLRSLPAGGACLQSVVPLRSISGFASERIDSDYYHEKGAYNGAEYGESHSKHSAGHLNHRMQHDRPSAGFSRGVDRNHSADVNVNVNGKYGYNPEQLYQSGGAYGPPNSHQPYYAGSRVNNEIPGYNARQAYRSNPAYVQQTPSRDFPNGHKQYSGAQSNNGLSEYSKVQTYHDPNGYGTYNSGYKIPSNWQTYDGERGTNGHNGYKFSGQSYERSSGNDRQVFQGHREIGQRPDGVYPNRPGNSVSQYPNPSGAGFQQGPNSIPQAYQSLYVTNQANVQSNHRGYSMDLNVDVKHSPLGIYQEKQSNFQPIASAENHSNSRQYQDGEYYHHSVPGSPKNDGSHSEISHETSKFGECRGTVEELDRLSEEGKVKEAVEVLALLQEKGIALGAPQYFKLMQACGNATALAEARTIHNQISQSTIDINTDVNNKIVEMYAKCGLMEDAKKLFGSMAQQNLTSWNTMISGFVNNGCGEEAIDFFDQFKQMGHKPDSNMFVNVILACGILGSVDEGMFHFESMQKDFDITPTMEHYVSIVNMFGQSGYIDEAREFVERMPVEPSIDVWETLMNMCRLNGFLELGDRCAQIIERLDPSRLTEHSKMGLFPVKDSDLAKEKERKKANAFEVRSKVHEYRAGDRSHPEHPKIYEELRYLAAHMKEAGYIADTRFVLHDVDQETKEDALLAHSERLAVAYGLITSAARSPIRVIKNLRSCGDCHTALKIISKLVGRQIIARDAKRFHHFENGVCSCKDYW